MSDLAAAARTNAAAVPHAVLVVGAVRSKPACPRPPLFSGLLSCFRVHACSDFRWRWLGLVVALVALCAAFLIKILKNRQTVSTTDGWLTLNFASCVVRMSRSLAALVLCSIRNILTGCLLILKFICVIISPRFLFLAFCNHFAHFLMGHGDAPVAWGYSSQCGSHVDVHFFVFAATYVDCIRVWF